MNIDEFIEHTQETARKHKSHADFFKSDNSMRVACIKSAEDCEWLAGCLTKFKEYQQLEEQGRLIKLPCNVGDTIYVNNGFTIFEYEVTLTGYSSTSKESGFYFVTKSKKNSDTVQEFSDGDFGKTVFLTREEAEAKLKKLKGEENE